MKPEPNYWPGLLAAMALIALFACTEPRERWRPMVEDHSTVADLDPVIIEYGWSKAEQLQNFERSE